MAKMARVALDIALVSLKTVKPAVTKVWHISKERVGSTRARPLVMNPVVTIIANQMDNLTTIIESKLKQLRNKQYEGEMKQLEKELERVKQKLEDSRDSSTSCSRKTAGKAFRPVAGQAWQYAKVEMVPPMTQDFFQGAGGRALEKSVGGIVDSVIASIQASINAMDAAAERSKKAQEAKVKAAEQAAAEREKERALSESKKKEETKKKGEGEAKAAETAAKAKQDADKAQAQKAAEAKKAQPKPAEKPKQAAKKSDPPKKK